MGTTVLETPPTTRMDDLLRDAIAREASDLHLVVGSPPALRIHGRVCTTPGDAIDAPTILAMMRDIAPPDLVDTIHAQQNVDFSLERTLDGRLRRFRVNVFRARGQLGCAMRVILSDIPSFDWAGFPAGIAQRIAGFRNGLILFTGITGSGKSTSMAMLIKLINERGGSRIITIEEPIEYIHEPIGDSIISQREVGRDLASFCDGLKYGLRQDPDVVLVGEVRDRETAALALSAAETGHLVLTTMHTRDAKGAITRMTDMFAHDAQAEIRTQLAMSLRAVVSQHLIEPAQPGQRRALALEVLFNNLPIGSAIRSGKVETISDAILGGRSEGMISLDDNLRQLVQAQQITPETARHYANDPRRVC